MADDNTIGADSTPAAEPQPPKHENMIPQSRFNEVNEARKAADAELAALKAKQAADAAKQLEDQQKWQELAEQRKSELEALEPFKAQAESAQAVMQQLLDAQLEQMSDDVRAMVDTMPGDVQQKLNWLAANQAKLVRPPAPQMDAGARGDSVREDDTPITGAERIAMIASGLGEKLWRERKRKMATTSEQPDRDAYLQALRDRNKPKE